MAKVERATEPHDWSSWAATRHELAALVDEAAAIVRAETGEEPRGQIDVPGYEPEFENTDDLLAQVDEKEWLELARIGVRVASGSYPETLSASIYLLAGAGSLSRVTLRLSGRTRRSRNAVMPDLVAAIQRHARPSRSPNRIYILALIAIYLPILVLQQVIVLSLVAWLDLSLPPEIAAIIVASVTVIALMTFFAARTSKAVIHLLPSVELLADDGVSRWDTAVSRYGRIVTVAGAVIMGIAAIVIGLQA